MKVSAALEQLNLPQGSRNPDVLPEFLDDAGDRIKRHSREIEAIADLEEPLTLERFRRAQDHALDMFAVWGEWTRLSKLQQSSNNHGFAYRQENHSSYFTSARAAYERLKAFVDLL